MEPVHVKRAVIEFRISEAWWVQVTSCSLDSYLLRAVFGCLMEMVPSACDAPHWQWLGWVPVNSCQCASIASVSSRAHMEQKPHGVCLHLLFSSYTTNAWELLGIPGLGAYGRTAAFLFCMLLSRVSLGMSIMPEAKQIPHSISCAWQDTGFCALHMLILNHAFTSRVWGDIK